MTREKLSQHVQAAVRDRPGAQGKAEGRTGATAHALEDGEIWLQSSDSVTLQACGGSGRTTSRAASCTCCAAAPGRKTTIALAMATTITRCHVARWHAGRAGQRPDLERRGRHRGHARARLTAMGADMRSVQFVKGTMRGGKVRAFDPAADMPALTAAASARCGC